MQAEYTARLEARRRTLADRERTHVRMSRLRLAIAAAGVVMLFAGGAPWVPWLLVPLAAFLIAAAVHARVLDARDRARSAVAFYERGLARLRHEWMGQGSRGDQYAPAGHPYAEDLDLFGCGSLFELLSSARTRAGEDTLAAWLLAPAPPTEVRDRQAAVRELAPMLDLREAVAVLGDGIRIGVDAPTLRGWAASQVSLGRPAVRLVLAALATITAALLGWWLVADPPPVLVVRAAVILLGVHGLIGLWYRARVQDVLHAVDPASRDLELLTGLLHRIETATFTSPRLRALQAELGGRARPASAEIARLAQLVALLRSRRNVLFALPAALVLWTTQVAHGIEAWRRRAGPHVARWLAVSGEFEALTSMAAFAAEHPDYAFPEVVASEAGPATDEEDGDRTTAWTDHGPASASTASPASRQAAPMIEVEGLAHVLLPDTAVPNDVALGADAPHLLIVSGSNMSGKSTFLRALGVAVVLAQAGAPVRATRFRCTPLAVGASIRIQDSLQDGRSRFFAEITRLKQVVDLARTRRGGALFLLDEILAGTNSHDRRHGAEALLRGLIALGAIGLATTHDLALGEIVHHPDVRAANVHFEDAFVDGVLRFDYRLRPGLVRTSNALELMRSIGLEV
ncbi:MAG: hypothetical protein R2752_16210 [Vicinamibacterales bacterium]